MKKLIVGLLITMAFSTAAQAGQSAAPLGVEVEDLGGGITRVQGVMSAVRFTDDDVQQIGCSVAVFQGGVPRVQCIARDIDENLYICRSFDPALIEAAKAISPYSFILFDFDGSATCTTLLTATRSQHIPDSSSEKGKTK